MSNPERDLRLRECFKQMVSGSAEARRSAFSSLYNEFAERFTKVLIHSYRLSRDDALDVIMDFFEALYSGKDLSLYAESRNPYSYLWGSLRFHVLSYLRRRASERKNVIAQDDSADDVTLFRDAAADGRELHERNEERDCLHKALFLLQKQSHDRWEVLELHALTDMGYREIGEMLGKKESATKDLCMRARRAFIELLQRHCGELFPVGRLERAT